MRSKTKNGIKLLLKGVSKANPNMYKPYNTRNNPYYNLPYPFRMEIYRNY